MNGHGWLVLRVLKGADALNFVVVENLERDCALLDSRPINVRYGLFGVLDLLYDVQFLLDRNWIDFVPTQVEASLFSSCDKRIFLSL